MNLTKMRYGGVPPFTEPVEFSFDEQVNLFVGTNATGKSRLLSAIDERFNERSDGDNWIRAPDQRDLLLTFCEEADYFDNWTKGKNLICADKDLAEAYFGRHANPRPPVIYIGPTRIGLPGVSELGDLGLFWLDCRGSPVRGILWHQDQRRN